ncbi:MAG: hypothetical protein HOO67_01585 [Candidatus Peribacteraceae bacterium]|nr:hypothetical protein [Candidatus Peribacteraceae bacterium]
MKEIQIGPITVRPLKSPVRYGDWHDKPLRWEVSKGNRQQLFSLKSEAIKYARIWRKTADELTAINTFIARSR